mgnify:FL=1
MNDEFEKWLANQSQEVRDLIAERFSALENTVKATRSERDTFKKELKEISAKVEVNSEAGKQLEELQRKLSVTEKKASFIEEAVKQGATRPSIAYAILNSENLYDAEGNPDWKKLKEAVPELFKVQNTKNNAGAGTNTVPTDNDPNIAIRNAAHNK